MGRWRDAKFGIFIHWGPYSALGGNYEGHAPPWGTEWIRHTARIPRDDYSELAMAWNPAQFHATEWTDLIVASGARYAVLTAKHHDGFCLWDSATTSFKLPNTPCGMDALAEFTPACRAAGLLVGCYYSPRDWHHPDFLPRYEILADDPQGLPKIGFRPSPIVGPSELPCGCISCVQGIPFEDDLPPAGSRNVQHYYEDLRLQLDEIMTLYGDIDILWFDGQDALPSYFPADEIVAQLRAHRPGLIINDRLGIPPWTADFGIHENVIPGSQEVRDWESCDTMNYTWGFGHHWTEWHTPRKMIHDLCDIVSKGGNYLLNIGPDGDGRIPESCAERLRAIGQWLERFGEAIYATKRTAQPPSTAGVRYTCKGDSLYVLQLEDPGSDLWLGDLHLNPQGRVTLLGSTSHVRWENSDRGLHLRIAEMPLATWQGQPALAFRLEGTRFITQP